MNKLLETAYKKLRELEQGTAPTWETYEKISMLYSSIQCLESHVKIDAIELGELLTDMRDNFGDARTLDILSSVLCAFKKDIDVVSPHLAACLVKKIKENL